MGEYLYLQKNSKTLQRKSEKNKRRSSMEAPASPQWISLYGSQQTSPLSHASFLFPVIQRKLNVIDEIEEGSVTDEFITEKFTGIDPGKVAEYKSEVIALIKSDLENTFPTWGAVKTYIDAINQHVKNMEDLAGDSTHYKYNKTPANQYLNSTDPNKKLFPKDMADNKIKLNCWSAVLYAAINVNGKTMNDLKPYAKTVDIKGEDDSTDPVLKLMEHAEKIDLSTFEAEAEKEAAIKKIPKGYIVAVDSPGTRQRNNHVFLCIGNGKAIEYDEAGKGETDILTICKKDTYNNDTDLWYAKPPWL